jgi:hypothetical protein
LIVILTSSPQIIAAITATIDFEIFVKRIKDMLTESASLSKGFLNKNLLTLVGQFRKEKTKEIYVIKPRTIPSYIHHNPHEIEDENCFVSFYSLCRSEFHLH